MPLFRYFTGSYGDLKNEELFQDTTIELGGYYVCLESKKSGYSRYFYERSLQSETYHNDIYTFFGYRRELTEEEIRLYLQGKYSHPAFDDWLEEEASKYSSFEEMQRAFNKRFNVRGRLTKTYDGKVIRKCDASTLPVFDDESWEIRLVVAKKGQRRFDNNKNLFTITASISSDSEYIYSIGGRELHLYDIISDAEYCEEHNEIYFGDECPKCAAMYKINRYSENALDYFGFKAKPNEKNPVYFGIELEYDTPKFQAKYLLKEFNKHMIAKEDGSIKGFELVTAPATFAVHKEEFELFPFENQVVSKATGMHVHVGRKELNTLQIGKMCEFVYNPDNKGFLEKIAGRNMNSYCSTEAHVKGVSSATQETERGLEFTQEGSHGTALNISSKGTIEFRIFRSPETKEQFLARLEFVKAMVDWTKPGAVAIPIKGFKEEKNFLNFVTDCRKVYPNLFQAII